MEPIERRIFLRWSLGLTGVVLGSGFPSLRVGTAFTDSGGPVLVVGQGLSGSAVELLWTAVAGAESYRVYRDGALVGAPAGTLHRDGGLPAASTASYAVSAVVDGVETSQTSVVVATQPADDGVPPTQPGAIRVTNVTSDSARLSWPRSADNRGVVGYRIVRGPEAAGAEELLHIAVTDGQASYTASALRADSGYQFGVQGIDAAGNVSPLRTVTVRTKPSSDTAAPTAPSSSSVSGSAFSESRVDLTWGPSSSSDVVAYEVFRTGERIAEVALPARRTYSDCGLPPASRHLYQVRAVDSAGNRSSLTVGRSVTTLAAGTVRITRGPYLQWATSTSVRVAWFTNVPAPSVVEYGIGDLVHAVRDDVLKTQHVLLLGALSPGTEYAYRASSGPGAVVQSTLRTAAAPGQDFLFAAVGDFGGGSTQESAIAARIAALGSHFVQTLGDNVYPDSQDPDPVMRYSDYDARLYKPYRAAMQQQAFWVANGNKEYYGDGAVFRNFWMPNNRQWYSYDWGDAHILVLDTEQPFVPGTTQHDFAGADLATHQGARWRVVVTHRPPYSSTTKDSSSTAVADHLVPLFEASNVHLVLSGNSHNYERSHPLRGGAPESGGVTYVVSGGGGNGLNKFAMAAPSWSAFRSAVYEFVAVSVTPSSLELRALDVNGTVFDSVTIT